MFCDRTPTRICALKTKNPSREARVNNQGASTIPLFLEGEMQSGKICENFSSTPILSHALSHNF